MATFKGKVVGVKLNEEVEKSNGSGTFEAHQFRIENSDGKKKTFTVSVKEKPAPYIEKLKKGQEVEVTTGGKFNSVVKVFVNNGKGGGYKGGYNKGGYSKGGYGKSNYKDNTEGQICGMILNNSVELMIASHTPEVLAALKPVQKVKLLVAEAAVLLSARTKVDALVKQALKSKDEDADDVEADEEDDQEEAKPKKKAKKPSDDEDDDFGDDSDADDKSSDDDESSDEDEAF